MYQALCGGVNGDVLHQRKFQGENFRQKVVLQSLKV